MMWIDYVIYYCDSERNIKISTFYLFFFKANLGWLIGSQTTPLNEYTIETKLSENHKCPTREFFYDSGSTQNIIHIIIIQDHATSNPLIMKTQPL